jgi:FkbM family methyltransferase
MGQFYQHALYQNFFSLPSTIIKTVRRNCQGQKFEPEVVALTKLINPGSICIDVGGAYGRYAFPLSGMVGSTGKIFSFEPGSYSYKVFSCVKFFFNLRNVTLIKKAVSNRSGSIELCLPPKKSGKLGVSLAHIHEGKKADSFCEEVQMVTLDDFAKTAQLARLDLIKCDTEGSELLVFQGAKNTIERFKPIVLTEIDIDNLVRYQQKPSDVINFFRQWNYKLMIWQAGKFVEVKDAEKSGNYFFIPEQLNIKALTGPAS